MEIATAPRGNDVETDTETADRGRTGRLVEVSAATNRSATPWAWRIWAGIILAQILTSTLAGTTPSASAVCIAMMIPAALVDVRCHRLPNRLSTLR